MKKLFATLLGLAIAVPVMAEPKLDDKSLAALGCMKLRECTTGVFQIESYEDYESLSDRWWSNKDKQELIALIDRLNLAGVEVFVAADRHFPRAHRALYFTDVNRLFINAYYLDDPNVILELFRHEGWHAVQDCMAGTIKNTFIAVIFDPELIPNKYKLDADIRYGMFQPKAIPWEQEALFAADQPNMTADALNACIGGEMWNEYQPTDLTRAWLEKYGYID